MASPSTEIVMGRAARVREWFASRDGLIALALLVGVGAGLGDIVFHELVTGLTRLFSGHQDYSDAGRAANPRVPWLGPYFVLITPVIGGLLYGPLIARFAPEARGHGVPEVMRAVAETGGRIRPQVPAVKAVASALTIGSGGSVGQEGPIVQIGAALGSVVGQIARVPAARLRLLVACGAAGGIAATFNAPIAGVFFALEVILGEFETHAFGLVVLSSVVAASISRAVFGSATFLTLPHFTLVSPAEFVLYAALGAAAGAVGVAFIKVLYAGEDFADELWKGPQWLRPAVGGLLLGLLLLALPQMYGVGYPVLGNAVGGRYAAAFLVLLLAAKILATTLTVSIGGSGGVFAPSLFMGAMLGAAFGQGAHALFPGFTAPAGAYALVGMGAVFAGSARAPITAVLIVFELTGEYSIILPLMLAIVVATGVSQLLSRETIYTLKLARRGINVHPPRVRSVMRTVAISEAMRPAPAPLRGTDTIDAAIARLTQQPDQTIPVTGDHDQLIGVITAEALEQAATADPGCTIAQLTHQPTTVGGSATLEHASQALALSNDTGLAVLDDSGTAIIGWASHRDILSAYQRQRDRSTTTR